MQSTNTIGFADLALAAPVMDALKRIGYEQPSPIQAESIPPLLAGKDLLGTAQTGTGKTAAFALPILSTINTSSNAPQALILAPTRELAIQVAEAFQNYGRSLKNFRVLPIYGGQGMDTQLRQLRRGVQVVVGTPGRVMDHLRRGTLKLDNLQTVVLDEADEMLRMGFIDDVNWILEHTPKERQVALFSATMPPAIRKVVNDYLNDPVVVKIASKTSTVERIEQFCWTVRGTNKLDALTRILEVEPYDGIILFVRTKTLTVELADKLEARGHSAAAINGDMTQKLRESTIDKLKAGKIDILVATDVAARGIDVARISHVINYDIPYDTEAYVHRIGRTGRAGRSGKAILFVAPREQRLLKAIEKTTGQVIKKMELPSRAEVNAVRIQQFKDEVIEVLERGVPEHFSNLVNDFIGEHNTDPIELAAAFAVLSQKGKPSLAKKDEPVDVKTSKDSSRGSTKPGDEKLERYRLAVGYEHKVKPGDIVGAIANEAGIDSKHIGRIEFHDDYCTVDLPAGMPDEVFDHLKSVQIRNHPLDIQRTDEQPGPARKSRKKPRKSNSTKRGKPKGGEHRKKRD